MTWSGQVVAAVGRRRLSELLGIAFYRPCDVLQRIWGALFFVVGVGCVGECIRSFTNCTSGARD